MKKIITLLVIFTIFTSIQRADAFAITPNEMEQIIQNQLGDSENSVSNMDVLGIDLKLYPYDLDLKVKEKELTIKIPVEMNTWIFKNTNVYAYYVLNNEGVFEFQKMKLGIIKIPNSFLTEDLSSLNIDANELVENTFLENQLGVDLVDGDFEISFGIYDSIFDVAVVLGHLFNGTLDEFDYTEIDYSSVDFDKLEELENYDFDELIKKLENIGIDKETINEIDIEGILSLLG